MKKNVFIFICFLIFESAFSQTDEVKTHGSLALGINYFPSAYYKQFYNSYVLNYRPYGYHLGYCFKPFPNKLFLRTGINGNYFWTSPSHYANELDFAFEFGIEYPFLKPERKWKLDGAFCVFPTGQFYLLNNPHSHLFSFSAGPLILFGRKLNEKWLLFTEINVSFGHYWYNVNLYDPPEIEITSYRFLGIGIRYQLGNK